MERYTCNLKIIKLIQDEMHWFLKVKDARQLTFLHMSFHQIREQYSSWKNSGNNVQTPEIEINFLETCIQPWKPNKILEQAKMRLLNGYKRKWLFHCSTDQKMDEVSVQTHPGRKLHMMYQTVKSHLTGAAICSEEVIFAVSKSSKTNKMCNFGSTV